MAGGSRRTHTKSRNGCSQCKKRRKKCNEQPPRCSNCIKWGISCDFGALSVITEPANPFPVPRYPISVPSDSYCLSTPMPIPTLNFIDLELMHQYATRTSHTLSRKIYWDIWQTNIPQEGQSFPFLMHAILAISALHISHLRLNDREKYARIARDHHGKALALFRSTVFEVTHENATATTILSLLIILFSTGIAAIFDFPDMGDPVLAFVEILTVLRHSWRTIKPFRDTVEAGPIGNLIKQQWNPWIHPLNARAKEALDALEASNASSTDSPDDQTIYSKALLDLRFFFTIVPPHPPNWAHTLLFPTTASVDYFNLLRAKKPMALVILAHWTVPLYHAPKLWYMRGWGRKVMDAIWMELDEEWRAMMTWPAEEFALDSVGANTCRHGQVLREPEGVVVLPANPETGELSGLLANCSG